MLNKIRSENCIVAAFYWTESHSLSRLSLAHSCVNIARACGATLNLASLKRLGGKKIIKKSIENQKVEDIIADNVNESILVTELIDSEFNSLNRFSLHLDFHRGFLVITIPNNLCCMNDALQAMWDSGIFDHKFRYGFVTERDISFGPSLFPIGIVQGLGSSGKARMESFEISFWGDAIAAGVWECGKIRDVYCFNILNDIHLDFMIQGRRFRDWIAADSERGDLEILNVDSAIWTVEYCNITKLRHQLVIDKMVYDWTRDIAGADLHPSAGEYHNWLLSR